MKGQYLEEEKFNNLICLIKDGVEPTVAAGMVGANRTYVFETLRHLDTIEEQYSDQLFLPEELYDDVRINRGVEIRKELCTKFGDVEKYAWSLFYKKKDSARPSIKDCISWLLKHDMTFEKKYRNDKFEVSMDEDVATTMNMIKEQIAAYAKEEKKYLFESKEGENK